MTTKLESRESRSLEEQLESLDITLPAGVVQAALHASMGSERLPRRTHSSARRGLILGALGAGVVGANIAAAYQVPAYGDLFAKMPFLQDRDRMLIQDSGIPPETALALDLVAIDQGYVVHLRAAYADTTRTTLAFDIQAVPGQEAAFRAPGYMEFEITDADGNVTTARANSGGVVGATMRTMHANLPPLQGASANGAPVKFRVTSLDDLDWKVSGSWEFELQLVAEPAPALEVPAGRLRAGDSEFEIISIQLSGFILTVEYRVFGPVVERESGFWNAPTVDLPRMGETTDSVMIFAVNEDPEAPPYVSVSGSSDDIGNALRKTVITVPESGNYRLKLGNVEQEGWLITIP